MLACHPTRKKDFVGWHASIVLTIFAITSNSSRFLVSNLVVSPKMIEDLHSERSNQFVEYNISRLGFPQPKTTDETKKG